jgi:hypothetical protein
MPDHRPVCHAVRSGVRQFGTQRRIPKLSAAWYREGARAARWQIDASLKRRIDVGRRIAWVQ